MRLWEWRSPDTSAVALLNSTQDGRQKRVIQGSRVGSLGRLGNPTDYRSGFWVQAEADWRQSNALVRGLTVQNQTVVV